MKSITLSRDVYRDKVYACWLGKNIGGTLGAPHEGKKEVMNLTTYDPMPSEAAANDDLDLQLVWLKMLQERGIYPTLGDFADYWLKHLAPYPWDEYGYCLRNLSRGLRPPISGCFENDYIDQMGSPIRSEIWACIAPGDPQLAATMAWKDAVLDHAGGEGVYGEMFWAAVQSAAFVINNPMTLIRIGLSMIPVWSTIARAVNAAIWCHENDIPWDQAREKILNRFGHAHPCNGPQNHGFEIMGWLYGDGYGDILCKAVNCGYDTDCTGATLGALLGILGGTAAIPDEWRKPVGERIILFKFTQIQDAPKTIQELTDQTVEIGEKVIAERSRLVQLGAETKLPENLEQVLSENGEARELLKRDYETAAEPVEDYEIVLHYHGEPVARPGLPKTIGVSVEKNGKPVAAQIDLLVPGGWELSPRSSANGEAVWRVVPNSVADKNRLTVKADVVGKELSASFLILGPEGAKGVPPAEMVPRCKVCAARIECCVCEK